MYRVNLVNIHLQMVESISVTRVSLFVFKSELVLNGTLVPN